MSEPVSERDLGRVERFLDDRLSRLEDKIEQSFSLLAGENKTLANDIKLLSVEVHVLKANRTNDARWIAGIGGAVGFIMSIGIQAIKLFLDS